MTEQPVALPPGAHRRREPALDGLRALSVMAVLLYHQPVTWLPGGFLGVSTFFTLSGFLIARLLVDSLILEDTIRLRRFTARRLRRLTPAAVTVALVTVVWWSAMGRPIPRGDVPAAIGYVSNWWLLHLGHGYNQLFGIASPLQHYWSLAIEEQFYLAFPLVALALFRLGGRRLRVLAIGVGTLAVGSFVLAALLPSDTAYYATPARVGEILVGALLAIVSADARILRGLQRVARSAAGPVIAIGSLTTLLWLWSHVHLADASLFPWATLLNAAASVGLIVECSFGRSLRGLFGRQLPASLGRVSYSLYLVHWPIFLWMTPTSAMPGFTVFFSRAAVSVLASIALFQLVEEPVRLGMRWRRPLLPLALGGLAAATISLATFAVRAPNSSAVDTSAIAAQAQELLTRTAPPPQTAETESAAAPTPTAGAPAPRPLPAPLQRVLFVGDSTSWSLSLGVAQAFEPAGVEVKAFPAVGCGIGGATPIRYLNLPERVDPACQTWFDQLPQVIDNFRPDVVLIAGGVADLSDRQLPDGTWAHIGDPTFDAWLTDRMHTTVRLLQAHGASVGWLTLPHLYVLPNPGFTGPGPFGENDPARADRYDELIGQVTQGHDGAQEVDFAQFLQQRPGGEFAEGLRPDGVHIDTRSFPDIAAYLVAAANELHDHPAAA